jgi:hydrogenase expression/formation protein HypC
MREEIMCLGIPGQIVEIVDEANCLAKVDVSGVQRMISIRLLAEEGLQPQDWVLVHVGFAMARIDEEEAQLTLAAVQQLGEAYRTEIEAFDTSSIV